MCFTKELCYLNNNKAKVCILGAGAGGLCAIRNFLKFSDKFDIEAFEKTGSVGGTWVYNEKREVDEFGLPIHSSMYEKLRTNIPLHVMEYPDFGSDEKIRQKFVSHKDVLGYLENYAKDSNAYQYIKFYHLIQNISRDVNCWKVTIKNLKTNEIFTNYYDVVLICNGRYSKPSIPESIDLTKFKGKILHSHNYRRAEEYKDERVVILGCGPSGLDIALELNQYAKEIYTLHLLDKNFKDFPDKIKQINDVIEYAEDKTVHTVKGKKLENIDTIIFATGYEYDYDFLDDNVGIKLQDNGKLSNIFQHLINSKYTTMCLLAIPQRILPFPMYHQQLSWYIQYLLGKLELPTKEEMDRIEEEDYNERIKQGIKPKHAHKMVSEDDLWNLEKMICDQANLPRISKSKRNCFNRLHKLRTEYATSYKDWKYIEHNDTDFELKI